MFLFNKTFREKAPPRKQVEALAAYVKYSRNRFFESEEMTSLLEHMLIEGQ